MNYTKILGRAWKILWSYKTLWIFGIIVGITAGGGGGGGGGGSGNRANLGNSNGQTPFQLPGQLQNQLDGFGRAFTGGAIDDAVRLWIGLGIAIICLLLIVGLFFRAAGYVSQVSLIRMVDGFETSGEKVGFSRGWRMGWSREAWRLFLIELVILFPIGLFFLFIFVLAALPLIIGFWGGNTPNVVEIISSVGLFLIAILLSMLAGLVIGMFLEVIKRVCVVEKTGVFASIRQGFHAARKRLLDVFLMWLILVGVQIGYTIVVIPVVLVVGAIGLVIGGGAGFGTYFALQASTQSTSAWVPAALLGIFLLFVVVSIPMTFLAGLKETYMSSSWTLAYRELTGKTPSMASPTEEPAAANS